ncbi:hypothetical protein ACFV7Q_03025 [Streptomyces sp. NPDC059851]|uniref:hypothetical protein n=1 Tax=Streptomyces sp. NPDC059851 TaxID=3346971 RepID=UPI003666DD3F
MHLPDIDFTRIRALGAGGQRDGFEQFICELAAEESPHADATFVSLNGSGGDGGVECFWTLPDGSEVGWQAKFWVHQDDVDESQLNKSVTAALTVHPRIVQYTIAIPVDPTGPTARKGKSLQEKVYGEGGWLSNWRKEATELGVSVEFRIEWYTNLVTRLRKGDPSGARARYWFDSDVLPEHWWQNRLDDAVWAARPRYVPELRVDVPALDAIAALCGDPEWHATLDSHASLLGQQIDQLRDAEPYGGSRPIDLTDARDAVRHVVTALQRWRDQPCDASLQVLDRTLQNSHASVSDAEQAESEALTAAHGDEWDSPTWRQHQAEYMVAFPAARVDALRGLKQAVEELISFVAGPFERLPGARSMLLSGDAGRGKTFVTLDAVARRLSRRRPSLFVHGRWFRDGDLLTQLRERLHLPTDLTGEEVLAILDQAGRSSGSPMLVVIDALNETRPRTVWRDELDRLVGIISRFENLRVVFTLRSHYTEQIVPSGLDMPTFIHRGFQGVEFEAVTEYADHYGLEPPTAPPIHGEFDNPLFLRLLCDALKQGSRLSLDQASMGIDELAHLLLDSANERISSQLDAPRTDRIVHRAMYAFAHAIGATPTAWLTRPDASVLLRGLWPDHTAQNSLLEALIGEGLLAEDIDPLNTADGGHVVVVAFERLGHHLVVSEALRDMTTPEAVGEALQSGSLRHLIGLDSEPDAGLLEALSVTVSHRFGIELTDFSDACGDTAALTAVIAGLPWRSAATITNRTGACVIQALRSRAVVHDAMDMLFRLAPRPDHPLNSRFLHNVLSRAPMARRDVLLTPWLHETHKTNGAVDRLITWAQLKDIDAVGRQTCQLWVTALLWCTGCSDRRVRDSATLAAARLLTRHPDQASYVLNTFLAVDDEWVAERACYASYAALLRGGSSSDWAGSAEAVWNALFAAQPVVNAALRDEARSIISGAADRGALPNLVELSRTEPPYETAWPIEWPGSDDVEAYNGTDYPKIHFSCIHDDFFTYQIKHAFRDFTDIEPDEAARYIVRAVIDLGYEPRLHAAFDRHVLHTYGAGRSKPKWIERIGKKYQWIALSRLVGQVSDHAPRTVRDWDPPEPATPHPQSDGLRQMDPTMCEPPLAPPAPRPDIPAYDWSGYADPVAEQRVADDSDLPNVPLDFVGPENKERVVITGSYEWKPTPSTDGNRPSIWTLITSLFVATSDLDALLEELKGRDLAGHDLFRGPIFLRGFVGEYPQGLHYASDAHVMNHEYRHPFAVPTERASYEILGEYEYAGTMETISLDAPAPKIFGSSVGSLRWDGQANWTDTAGGVVASVRKVTGGGQNELVMDRKWLDDWLCATNMAMVWLETSGKDVYTGGLDYSPGRLLRTRVRYRSPEGAAQLDPVYERVPPRTR